MSTANIPTEMEKAIKLNFITVLTLIILVFGAAGFYFGMSSRMEDAELEILYLQGQIRALKSDINHVNKLIIEKNQ
jgi:Tfp pilus assembly protein PilN